MKTNHIIIDAERQAYRCLNCGAERKIDFIPCSVDEFVAMGKVFIKRHRYCAAGHPVEQKTLF